MAVGSMPRMSIVQIRLKTMGNLPINLIHSPVNDVILTDKDCIDGGGNGVSKQTIEGFSPQTSGIHHAVS